jgi:DNA-binding PadR family transcriptional regulator
MSIAMTGSARFDELLPLKPIDFHILLVLMDGDLHGYGIVKEIEDRSEGRIRLEPGNLYRYVRRLVDEGLVVPAARRDVPSDGGAAGGARRRDYRVTPLGREVLRAEAMRMRSLVAATEARLTLPPETP